MCSISFGMAVCHLKIYKVLAFEYRILTRLCQYTAVLLSFRDAMNFPIAFFIGEFIARIQMSDWSRIIYLLPNLHGGRTNSSKELSLQYPIVKIEKLA